jgi:predicted PurR-regulated permease PerM
MASTPGVDGAHGRDRWPLGDSRNRLTGALIVLATIAAVWFLSWAKGLLIPLSFALFLSALLGPAVERLARWHVPRPLGAALVLLALSGLGAFAGSRTRADAVAVFDQLPSAARYLRREFAHMLSDPRSLAHRIELMFNLPNGPSPSVAAAPVAGATSAVAQGTMQLLAVAGELGVVLFLVYLMLAARGSLQQRLTRTGFLPAGMRSSLGELERALQRYFGVLVITNALLGLLIWGAFHLLGVNYAAAWGVASALLHFVPYVGPAAISIGSAISAALQFSSLAHGLLIGAVALTLCTLVGMVLQTWLFGHAVHMNTVAVFVSLIFWSWLWGLPGMVLATPLTMVFKSLCSQFSGLGWIDVLLDGHGRKGHEPGEPATPRSTVLSTVQRVLPNP